MKTFEFELWKFTGLINIKIALFLSDDANRPCSAKQRQIGKQFLPKVELLFAGKSFINHGHHLAKVRLRTLWT